MGAPQNVPQLAPQSAPQQQGAAPIAVPLLMPGANGQMQTSFALVSPQILLQAAIANVPGSGQSIPTLGGGDAGLGGGNANIVSSLLQVISGLIGNQQQQSTLKPAVPAQAGALQQIATMAQNLGQSAPGNSATTDVANTMNQVSSSPQLSDQNPHSSPASSTSSLANLTGMVQNSTLQTSPSNPAGLPAGLGDPVSVLAHAGQYQDFQFINPAQTHIPPLPYQSPQNIFPQSYAGYYEAGPSGTNGGAMSDSGLPEPDKRTRNTAASARFRAKKKLREQALERKAKEMTAKVTEVEQKIHEMNREVLWLRGLIADRDGPDVLEAYYKDHGLGWDEERGLMFKEEGEEEEDSEKSTSCPGPSGEG
ncbi:hypothetical protein HDV00_005360, partial [Rhizophlyctis rosea]